MRRVYTAALSPLFHFQTICDLVGFVLRCQPRCLRLVFVSSMIWKWNYLLSPEKE
jgi:hypothetical protein